MSTFGVRRETNADFRINQAIEAADDLFNGLGGEVATYIRDNRANVKDMFLGSMSIYVAMNTKEANAALYKWAVGKYDEEWEEYSERKADEIDWYHVDGVWYLGLWWD